MTRCRRVSCPWNNRPLRSKPTWRDLEKGIRTDMHGPSLMLTGPLHARSLHRLPQIATVDIKVMFHRNTAIRFLHPRPFPQWMQTQTQTIVSLCVRGQHYSFPPLSGACVSLEGGSDFIQTIIGTCNVIFKNVDHLLVAKKG